MKEFLTGDDLYAHVMMLRGVSNKTYILVEGDDDCGLIDPHLNSAVCETIPGHGKNATRGAAEIAESQNVSRVGAVLDLDWSDILYPRSASSNIFYTDHFDSDALAFSRKRNVSSVAVNFGSRDLLRQHLGSHDASRVWDSVVCVAFPVGVIRYLSEKNRWELFLRNFPIHEVLSGEQCVVDFRKLVEVAVSRSSRPNVSIESAIKALECEISKAENTYRYCCGHDLLGALAAFFKRVLGKQFSARSAGAAIRAAFSCSDAQESELFMAIDRWGRESGTDVLSCS